MNVIALTAFVGVVLVTLFVLLFILQACENRGSAESDALLPLRDDGPSRPE